MMNTILKFVCLSLFVVAFSPHLQGASTSATKCHFDFPPFLHKMQRGLLQDRISFNGASLDHNRYFSNITLMEWQCNLNRTWWHPLDAAKLYSIPDVIESIEFEQEEKLTFETHTYTDLLQVKQEMGKRTGLDVLGVDYGSFAYSNQIKKYVELMIMDGKIVTEKIAKVGTIHVTLDKSLLVASFKLQSKIAEFQHYDNYTFEFAADFYDYILHHLGTHYAEEAEFASLVMEVGVIDPVYLLNNTWEQVEVNMMRSLVRLINWEWFDMPMKEDYLYPTDPDFALVNHIQICGQTSTNVHSSGFECDDRLEIHGFRKWYPGAVMHPFMVKATLKPIESLFLFSNEFFYENLRKARQTRMKYIHMYDRVGTLKAQKLKNKQFPLTDSDLSELIKINETYNDHFMAYRNNPEMYYTDLRMAHNKLVQIDAKVQLEQMNERLRIYETGLLTCKAFIAHKWFPKNSDLQQKIAELKHNVSNYKKEYNQQLDLLEMPEFMPGQAFLLKTEFDTFDHEESNTQVDFCHDKNSCCLYDRASWFEHLVKHREQFPEARKHECLGVNFVHELTIMSLWPLIRQIQQKAIAPPYDQC